MKSKCKVCGKDGAVLTTVNDTVMYNKLEITIRDFEVIACHNCRESVVTQRSWDLTKDITSDIIPLMRKYPKVHIKIEYNMEDLEDWMKKEHEERLMTDPSDNDLGKCFMCGKEIEEDKTLCLSCVLKELRSIR